MSNLPPELADLNAQYEQIFERYSAGQLTEDQARMTIENIVALDGAGCAWRINPDPSGEEFLRAQPGGPFEPCNPMYFQPLTTPSAQVSQPAPWETAAPSQSWDAFGGAPQPAPLHDRNPFDGYAAGLSPVTSTGPEPWAAAPAAPSPSPKPRLGLPALPLGGFIAKLTADKRRLVGVAVIVAVILAFAVTRGGSEPSGETTPSLPPVSVPAPVTPVTSAPIGEPTALPTDADVARVRAALSSGQRETAAAVLVDRGSAHRQYLSSATWLGLTTVGIDVVPETITVAEDGTVTQKLLLVERSTAQPVTVATFVWVIADGSWALAGWPALERIE
jgi:hypothetical protein